MVYKLYFTVKFSIALTIILLIIAFPFAYPLHSLPTLTPGKIQLEKPSHQPRSPQKSLVQEI